MSNSIDNRVVSMEFDNAKFERNVETSLNTLKHLDKSLEELSNSSRGFDGVSFENLANSIDSIADKFTLMGRITLRVFDEIAEGIVNLGKKMISFNTEQLESGWGKYAEKTTSVQTIMSATGMSIEDVSDQLERLNRFTDETSYSFVDMTSNIAKFTSQGVTLDSAVTSMQGIATWAASAGQNAQAASRAMYNISQAMGVGAMHLIDWKSIQNANMATKQFKEQAIAAAIEIGTLEEKNGKIFTSVEGQTKAMEVNIQNFAETLKNDWFSSEVMTSVFEEYGKFANLIDETTEATGVSVSKLLQVAEAQEHAGESADAAAKYQKLFEEAMEDSSVSAKELEEAISKLNEEDYKFSKETYKAAQEAKTFGDAIDALKDALSTSWMNVFETVFGNYEHARVLWTDMANWLYDIFAEPVNNLNNVLDGVMNNPFWGEFTPDKQVGIKNTAFALLKFGDAAEEAFIKSGVLSKGQIDNYGTLQETLKNITLTEEDLGKVIDHMLGSTTGEAKKGTDALEEYRQVVQDIWHGKYGSGEQRKSALEEAGYDYEAAQNLLNKWHYGIEVTEEDIARLGTKAVEMNEEQIKSLIELKQRLDDGTASLDEYMLANARMTGRELLFDRQNGAIYNLMKTVTNIRKTIGEAWGLVFSGNKADNIYRFIAAFQALSEKIKKLTTDNETFKKAMQATFTLLKIGLNTIKAVGSAIKRVFDVFKPSGEGQSAISSIINKISDLIINFDKWLEENEIFKKAVDAVVAAFERFKTAIDPVVAKVKELWNSFSKSEALSNLATFFGNVFSGAMAIFASIVETVSNTISKLIPHLVEFYNKHLSGAITAVSDFFKSFTTGERTLLGTITEVKNAVVDFFKILFEFIKNKDYEQFVANMTERFGDAAEKITTFVSTVKDWFAKLTGGNAGIVALVAGLLGLVGVLSLLLKFSRLKSAIAEVFWQLGEAVEAVKASIIGNIFIKVAASLLILAKALQQIGSIPEDELKRAKRVVYTMVSIIGGIAVAIAAVTAFSKGGAGVSMTFIGLSAFVTSMFLLVLALKVISDMQLDNILYSLGILGSIMVMLAIIAIGMSKQNVNIAGSGFTLIAYAAGILLLVKALKKIQEETRYIGPDAFNKLIIIMGILAMLSFSMRGVKFTSALGLLVMAASLVTIQKCIRKAIDNAIPLAEFKKYRDEIVSIVVMMGGLAAILRIAGKGGLGAALGILALVGMIFVVAEAMKKLGNLTTKEIVQGGIAITLIGGIFAGLLYLLSLFKVAEKQKIGGTTNIIATVAAIGLIMVALIVLSVMPLDKIIATTIGVGLVLSTLALVLFALSKIRVKSTFGMIISLLAAVGAIALLMYALKELANLGNGDELVKTAISMGLVMAALAASMYILSKSNFRGFDSTQAVQMMVKMVAAMIPALAALWLLSTFNIEASIETVAALSLLILALAGAIRIMGDSKADAGKSIADGFALLEAATAMIFIAFALKALDKVDIEGLLPKVIALGALFAEITAAAFVLTYSKDIDIKQIGKIGALMGELVIVLGIIVALMPLLDKIEDVDGLLKKTTAISELLLALSLCALVVTRIPDTASLKGATIGVIAIAEMIVALVAIFAGIGGIEAIFPKFGEILSSGAEILGEAIGKFIGAIGGGMVSGAIEAAADLDNFTKSLEPFMNQITRFDDKAIAGVTALAGMLVALAVADFASSIATIVGWLTGIPTNMGSNLVAFANAVKSYVDSLKGLEPGEVNKVSRITEAIAQLLQNMPSEGGIFNWFKGTQSEGMVNMGAGMKSFGTTLKDFVDSVKDIPATAVTKTEVAVQVATKLNEFAETLQKTGGLIQDIMGISDIGNFGIQLGKFVIGLFGGSVGSESFDGFIPALEQAELDGSQLKLVEKLKELVTPMVEIAEMIPTMGGYISALTGDNDPVTFTTRMVQFVQGVKQIITECAGITDEQIAQIRKAKEAALAAKELAAASEGQNIDLSAPTVVGGNETSSEASIVEKAVGGLQSKLSAFDIGSFPETMQRVKDSLNFKDVDTSNVEQSVETLQTATETIGSSGEVINSVAESCGQYFATLSESTAGISETVAAPLTELQNSTAGFSAGFDTQLNAMIESITSKSSDMQSGATTFFHAFPSAMESETAIVTENASTMVTGASAVLTTGADQASKAGYYFTAGFAQGILSGSFLAEQAARSVVQKASNAMESAAQEKSPSKLTQKFGSYFSQGFAIGILDESGTIRNASIKATKVAIDTVRDTMEAINNIIEEESSPVIRPVLDLTNLKEGAGYISSMTSGNIAAMASIQTADYRNTASFLAGQDHARANSPIYNLVIDGIKYNTDDYVDSSIQNFVETMVRKNKMYSGR